MKTLGNFLTAVIALFLLLPVVAIVYMGSQMPNQTDLTFEIFFCSMGIVACGMYSIWFTITYSMKFHSWFMSNIKDNDDPSGDD